MSRSTSTTPIPASRRYDLQRRQGSGDSSTVTSGPINATSITTTAQVRHQLEFRVVAWNLAGQAVSTNTVAVTTATVEPAAVPGAAGLLFFNDQWWKAGSPNPTDGTAVTVGRPARLHRECRRRQRELGRRQQRHPRLPRARLIRDDNFSTVFTGKITAPEDGQYQILGFSDDDSYVFVDGRARLADPGGHGVPTLTTDIDVRNPITLLGGQSYDFVAVKSEGGGGAAAISCAGSRPA